MIEKTAVLLLLGLLSIPAFSQDATLRFDQPQINGNALFFPDDDDDIEPVANDFQLLQALFMSNELGERWALVTLKNTSTGQRFLKNENLVATFADGSQSRARNVQKRFRARENQTVSVFFGVKKFPIVKVEAK